MNSIRSMNQGSGSGHGRKNRRGQVLVLIALTIPILCGIMGLAIDGAHFYHLKRHMQTAADAGAMAGAQELSRDLGFTRVKQAVLYDVAQNGFDGSHGEVIVINHPPLSGPQRGNLDFVEVIISQDGPTFFMGVLGIDSATVRARAVAGLVDDGASGDCVYVLDRSQDEAFEISSGSSVFAPNCGVIVNSSSQNALDVTSESSLITNSVRVVGGVESGGGTISPKPTTGVSPVDDPLAHLEPPYAGGDCTYKDFKISSRSRTLYPGVYCGGIKIESGSNAYLEPGVYILRGGGLLVGSGSTIEGHGVGFYNTSGSGYEYMPIMIASGSEARLSAPAWGEMEGVLFFQDRNAPAGYENKIESNTKSHFEGVLYFATQHLMFHSNTAGESSAAWTVIVANTLEVSSNTTVALEADFSNSSILPPIKKAALVE